MGSTVSYKGKELSHEELVQEIKNIPYRENTERNPKATDSDSEYKNVICDICGKIFSVEKSLESDDGWYCSSEYGGKRKRYDMEKNNEK